MAKIKSDPVPNLAEGTKKASEAVTKAAEATAKTVEKAAESTATAVSNGAAGSSMIGGIKIGSMANITTGAFATKAFIYGIIAVAVVGVVSIAAADQVSTALREQPSPQVATMDDLMADDGLVEVDEADEELDDDDTENEDITIDTSTWVEYTDNTIGITIKHPPTANVVFTAGDENNPAGINFSNMALSFRGYNDGTIAFFDSNNASAQTNKIKLNDGRNITFKSFLTGDGGPGNDEGSCFSGSGSRVHYAVIDQILVDYSNSYTETDCNEDNKLIRSETDPVVIETMKEIIKTIMVFDPQPQSSDGFSPDPAFLNRSYDGDLVSLQYSDTWELEEIFVQDHNVVSLTKDDTTFLIILEGELGIGFGPSNIANREQSFTIEGENYTAREIFIANCEDFNNCVDLPYDEFDKDIVVNASLITVTTDTIPTGYNFPLHVRIDNSVGMTLAEYEDRATIDSLFGYELRLSEIREMLGTMKIK